LAQSQGEQSIESAHGKAHAEDLQALIDHDFLTCWLDESLPHLLAAESRAQLGYSI
jgi:hypothetical protein